MTSTKAVPGQASHRGREGRARRYARPARDRSAADRARRGDQDRGLRGRGRKTYRFTVRFGAETDTDDAEGAIVAASDRGRPAPRSRRAAEFTGEISRCRRAFRRSRSTVPAPTTSPATRRSSSSSAARLDRDQAHRPPDADHCVLEANAARAPMCARSPAISAVRSILGQSKRCGGPGSGLRRGRA